ncbi:MAG TPA: ATP-dependent zinc metalloprotease FtsH [Acidimicrobiia bacterium]|jgi:cell division protease FtsH|nr:ATP-dependent zinc metalloprotease FtsH [Acidimicrobiia bacterium]
MTSRTPPNDKADSKAPEWRVEGMPEENKKSSWRERIPGGRWFWLIFLVLLAVNWFITNAVLGEEPPIRVPYTEFVVELEAGNVESVVTTGATIQGTFKAPVVDPDDAENTSVDFTTERPTFAEDDLLQALIDNDVVVNAEPLNQPAPLWQQIVFGFGPTLLLLWLFFSFYRRAGQSLGIGGLGSSRAKRYEASQDRTTFADVAGIDEAEHELVEVVDFLRDPGKYTKLGAAIPRGVLLSGAPGTGKTLLARAVAGEADAPFFSMAASEFIEMVVGVGASRVRDLFKQAKEAAPAIIFIDEIDSIGRARGGSMSFGGHDEREQTLNQILTEMDGFTGAEGVIVIAATNRPDVLDPALLRPGRFDRHVAVSPPDQVGRKAILEVHTRGVPLDSSVDLGSIASSTPGMVGAELRNLVNEGALMAARRGHERVQMNDFTDALEKVVLGAERKIMMSQEDRELTAYHESGHALLGMVIRGADPVRKISIIPRGRALGVTLQSPEADRYSYSEEYLRGKIVGALGGRAAEELVFGSVTTGAESDLVMVTNIAKSMVGRWGMSDKVGPLTVLPADQQERNPFSGPQVGPDTLELVDSEVRRIVDECYTLALELLKEHRDKLDALAAALLEKETLEENEAYELAGISRDR